MSAVQQVVSIQYCAMCLHSCVKNTPHCMTKEMTNTQYNTVVADCTQADCKLQHEHPKILKIFSCPTSTGKLERWVTLRPKFVIHRIDRSKRQNFWK